MTSVIVGHLIIRPKYFIHLNANSKPDYASLGTISSLDDIKGYPMVSIMSVADSPRDGKSTGDIYLYLLHIDYITHDLKATNKLTALFSDNEDLSCAKRGLDPMEPTCARVMITGYVAQVRDCLARIFSEITSFSVFNFSCPPIPLSITWRQTLSSAGIQRLRDGLNDTIQFSAKLK